MLGAFRDVWKETFNNVQKGKRINIALKKVKEFYIAHELQ